MVGIMISEKTRQRMSDVARRRHQDQNSGIGMHGRKHSVETRLKMSVAAMGNTNSDGQFVSEERRKKLRQRSFGNTYGKGYRHTEEAKRRTGENSRKCLRGRRLSMETRIKIRLATLAGIEKYGPVRTRIGRNEKMLLDQQESIDGVKILRQYPITALGYIVDGYCPETNTVYEVYEKAHDRRVRKDLARETEICNHLSCNFHILWDGRSLTATF